MGKGKLIIVESGSDASGKATQTELLYNRLVSEGKKCIKITFPDYDSESSALVKMYLRGDFGSNASEISPYIASNFYAADRYASFKTKWEEFYNNGGIVISDRYTTSNMVHPASKMEESEKDKYLNWLTDLEFNIYKIPTPDKVIFLNVEPEVSQRLMENRLNKFTGEKEKDIHENNKEYLFKSYKNALEIAEKYNWTKIDCSYNGSLRSIEDIHNEIYGIIREGL